MPAETASRILRLKTVLERTGLSRSTLYRKIERGTFPLQVQISERCVGWRETELDAWLRNPIYYSRAEEDPARLNCSARPLPRRRSRGTQRRCGIAAPA